MTYSYSLYGLVLNSRVPIPGLAQGGSSPLHNPVEFFYRKGPAWALDALRKTSRLICSFPADPAAPDPAFSVMEYGEQEFFQLRYSDGTQFIVDGSATSVWGECPADFSIEDLATYLLGPVMGFVLRLRGVTALHASAANVDGSAIILCGPAGAGKSTTVAALALRGVPVLCEDISPIYERGGSFWVLPGYPRVCLWPDSIEKLFGTRDALPRITPGWEKCFLPLDGDKARFERALLPLSVIYLLKPRSPDIRGALIEAVQSPEAVFELVRNTYMNRLLNKQQRAVEFDLLSRLPASVVFRSITPGRDGANLGVLCDAILEDASPLVSRGRKGAGALSLQS